VVRGGPGTGKSVIAMNLVGDLLLQGYNAQYATGSRAFTETLRKNIGTRGAVQFKYFNSYTDADSNAVDVLVCDEAHRIREFSHDRWTPKAKRSNKPQIHELLHVAKVAVFFIDDRQLVRPNEIGSAHDILDTAEKTGCQIFEHELRSFAALAPQNSIRGCGNKSRIRSPRHRIPHPRLPAPRPKADLSIPAHSTHSRRR
jgi:hypothetical protein